MARHCLYMVLVLVFAALSQGALLAATLIWPEGRIPYLLCIYLLLVGPLALADNTSSVNLIADGSFDAPGPALGAGAPWQPLGAWGSVRVETETGRVYADYEIRGGSRPSYTRTIKCLAIASSDPSSLVGAQTTIQLDPGIRDLLLTGIAMVSELTPGPQAGQRARCAMAFRMQDNSIAAIADPPSWSAPTPHWTRFCRDISVPVGATDIIISPQLDHCAGRAQFEDLGLEEVPAPTKWVLTFDDEFKGPTLDRSKWTASVGNADWQKNYYKSAFSPSNISFADGYLRICAEKRPSAGMPYTSAEIMTLGKFAQLYGCIETRVRMPKEIGSWPAVYMVPYDDTWPPEIDIAEATGRWPTTRMVNNHWKDRDGVHLQWSATFEDPAYDRSRWHTHRIVWDRGCLRFYIDGKLLDATSPETGIADMPMYLRINQVVGGWGGDPTPGNWPQNFDVAYIRVYQRVDRPLPVTLGPSREITLPANTATLTAQTCNPIGDGTTAWSLVSGPGAAAIASPRALTTVVSCSTTGMYRFRFTIHKDGGTGEQDELVYVNPPIPVQAASR